MVEEVEQSLVCQHVDGVASAPVDDGQPVDLLSHQHAHCIKQAAEETGHRRARPAGLGKSECLGMCSAHQWLSNLSIGSMLTRVDFNLVIFRSDTTRSNDRVECVCVCVCVCVCLCVCVCV